MNDLDLSTLEKVQVLARREHRLSRDTLVRYAGASGDFNPIHYNDTVAEAAGLPGVTTRPPDSALFSTGVRTVFGLPQRL